MEQIANKLLAVSADVIATVEGAREQALGLEEISEAVNIMGQGTQQNAVMVEYYTSASAELTKEAQALFKLMSSFEISNVASPYERSALAS